MTKSGQTLEHDWFPKPLPSNVLIGDGSWCYSSYSCLHYGSHRSHGVRVGSDSGIYNGTFFDLGPDGEVEIGNYCTLVGAIINTNNRVVIGDYAFLAHEVVLADDFAARPFEYTNESRDTDGGRRASIVVGPNSWVGARSVLLSGAILGEGVIVGAGAVVQFAVPPFAIVAGNPARIVGSSNTEPRASSQP